jgi:hemin uptake protein HemP
MNANTTKLAAGSPSEEAAAINGTAPPLAIARTTSQQLLGQRGELIIAHDGHEYSLRRTRNGKLILTK